MGNKSSSEPSFVDHTAQSRAILAATPGLLLKLVEAQDIEGVREFLKIPEGRFQLDAPDPEDDECASPLLVAASLGNKDLVKILVESGANLNAKTKSEQEGVVHRACASSSIELLAYLRTVIDFKTLYVDATPLHYAAFNGQLGVVKYLIEECEAPVDAAAPATGATPLCWGTKRGDGSVPRYLISKGANVEHADAIGRTPIFHAAGSGTLEALKVLVEEGRADVLHRDKYGNTAFSVADAADMWECTLYLYSVGGGNAGAVRSRGCGTLGSTSLSGQRLLLFGGSGLAIGSYYSNHYTKVDNLNEPHLPSTTRGDLFLIDFSKPRMSRFTLTDPAGRTQQEITTRKRHWNRSRMSHLLSLEEDGLTVRYAAQGSFRPGSLVANRPFEPRGTAYFEITVLDHGINGFISVGVVREGYSVDHHPGWYATSYAYHGDDGRTFWSTGTGCPWGPRFTTGDTVGLGINYETGEVFFTKNGSFLGVSFYRCPKKSFLPAVGMTSYGEKIKANFGDSPFLFNFEARLLKVEMPSLKGQLLPLATPFMFSVDEDGKEVILLGAAASWRSEIIVYTINTETWTTRLLNGDSATSSLPCDKSFDKLAVSERWPTSSSELHAHFDRSTHTAWVAFSNYLDGRKRIFIRKLDLQSSTWSHVAILKVPELVNDNMNRHPMCTVFVGRFLLIWNALQEQAYYVCYNSTEPILDWETVSFTGSHAQISHFSITALNDHQLLTFGGWDENGQTNHSYILDVVSHGSKCSSLVWSKPRVSGAVPRPRNDHNIYKVTPSLYVAYGGWNGWNSMDDFDVIHIQEERFPDSLAGCRSLSQFHDISIECSDDSVIHCNKIVLFARSSFFRNLLANSSVSTLRIPLTKVFAEALINYFYTDKFDPEFFDPSMLRIFMDDVVNTFAPDHRSRIAQQIMLARVHSVSTFGKEMEMYAWKNDLYTDVEFSVDDDSRSLRIRAHKAIVRSKLTSILRHDIDFSFWDLKLCARSDVFTAMFSGGLAESRANQITIHENSCEAFEVLIRYIYCGTIDIEVVEAYVVDLLLAASKYAVLGLKSLLEGVISQSLTPENVGSLILIAEQIDGQSLMQACRIFINSNLGILEQTQEFREVSSQVKSILHIAEKDPSAVEYEDVRWTLPQPPLDAEDAMTIDN